MPRSKEKRNPLPLVLVALGGVLLLVALFTLISQPGQGASPTVTAPVSDPATHPTVQRVTIGDAKAALDAGTAVFVDVRGPAAFAAGHIPGSRLIPLNELESRWNELDPNDWIITYCT